MYKKYNIINGQTNGQVQEKAVSDLTYQEVKSDQDHIRYLKILNNI